MGTLAEGASYLDVIIHPSQPTKILGGFVQATAVPHIRPTDGRLVYDRDFAQNELRVYHVDPFVPSPNPIDTYPKQPLANDPTIASPACTSAPLTRLLGFFPDDGNVVYGCADALLFLEGSPPNPLSFTREGLFALGAGHTSLARNSTGEVVVRSSSGTETVVTGLSPVLNATSRVFARFVDTEFLFAFFNPTGTYGQLWKITPSATATSVGVYKMKNGLEVNLNGARLDPTGALWVFTYAGGGDAVEKFSVDSPSVVVFQEAATTVKIHVPRLITGD